MRTTINVNRMQYGVGQGGFHCQEIMVRLDGHDIASEPYRFVYDCGSDTRPYVKNLPEALDWSIKHFSTRRGSGTSSKVSIDTLYLSHFHKDHINGVVLLSTLTDVREIVIPHISISQMVHIFAQQIDMGSITSVDPDDLQYVRMLVDASGQGPLIDGVGTTTRVKGDEPDSRSNQSDNFLLSEDQPAWPESISDAHSIGDDAGTKENWSHQRSRRLSLIDKTEAHSRRTMFWELRTWCYSQSERVSEAVKNELKTLSDNNNGILSDLLNGKFNKKEIEWAIENSKEICKAYRVALKKEGVSYACDNVVSLCLHSAPLHKYQRIRYSATLSHSDWSYAGRWPLCLFCRDDPPGSEYKGWVGTGDAMLGEDEVWNKFKAHYLKTRIEGWNTVQVPHHGSGRMSFNPGLLDGYPKTAVISAGAYNKYHHPAMSTLEKIADKGGVPVVVTEMMRLGFFEHLIYESN